MNVRYRYSDATEQTIFDSELGVYFPKDGGGYAAGLYRDWLKAGNVLAHFPPPTFEDYVAQFTPGLQAWMEQVAHSNAYDSVLSCVSYVASSVAQFAGDAKAMIDWRDALWKWASQWQAGFQGQLPDPIPTLEDVIAQAPQPEAFGWVVHTPGQIIEAHAPPENPTS